MNRDKSAGSVRCAQCGAIVRGRFCGSCGTAIDADEGLAIRIRSVIVDPLLGALAFLKIEWLVMSAPREFFDRYFKRSAPLGEMRFPLTALWRRLAPGPQKIMGPFQFLIVGVAFVAIVNGIHEAAWYHAGLGRYGGAGGRAFQHATGIPMKRIDLEHLTGVGLLDEPIHQIVDLLYYGILAGAVSLMLLGSGVTNRQLLHYYAYGKGVSLGLLGLAGLAGLAMFVALSGYSIEGAVISDTAAEIAGDATSLYFLFVLPAFLFPRVFSITRRRMKYALASGVIAWLLINGVLRFELLGRYGLLISFQ